MAIDRAFALGCLLLCSFAVQSVSGSLNQEIDRFSVVGALGHEIDRFSIFGALDQDTERFSVVGSAGGRHLQQVQVPCPHQFGYDNYTIINVSCPPVVNISQAPTYPKKACCAALASMLCPYLPLINDPNSLCISEFWSYLQLSTNLTADFFQFICTDPNSPQGIPCPTNSFAPAPSPNHSSPYGGSHFFSLIGLLSLGVAEILVILF